MHIERDGNGDFVLEPSQLATRFGLQSDDFRRKLRKGLVTSTVERGEGEHMGTCRLTVRIGNRVWRAILDSGDTVTSETLAFFQRPTRRP